MAFRGRKSPLSSDVYSGPASIRKLVVTVLAALIGLTGPTTLAGYGLTAEETAPYLMLPEGKKLSRNGTELELANR